MAKTKKQPTAQVIALLRKRPRTVPELVKLTKCSVPHVRSILYALENIKVEKQPAKYSLRGGAR
jgi:hypothetical protein